MKKLNIFIIILMFLSAGFFYPYLPAKMPMHWNIYGQVDSYQNKNAAVFTFPLLTIVMFIFFQILPSLDPKREKYQLFEKEWNTMQTGIIGFFAYMQFIVFYASINKVVNFLPLMFIGLGSLFIILGNYLSKIRQNYFIGIKTPWTLANEEVWNKTHRLASWCFVTTGVLTLAEAYFQFFSPIVIFSSIILAGFVPVIYSYILYKRYRLLKNI